MDRCIVCGKKLHKSRVPRIDKHPKIKKIQLDEDGDTYPVCNACGNLLSIMYRMTLNNWRIS